MVKIVKAIPEDKNIGKGITVYSGSFSPDGKTIALLVITMLNSGT